MPGDPQLLAFGNAIGLVLWILSSMGWNLCLWALWRRRIPVRAPVRKAQD